jgi:hypothetical protein
MKPMTMSAGLSCLIVGIVIGMASMAFWLVLIRRIFVC